MANEDNRPYIPVQRSGPSDARLELNDIQAKPSVLIWYKAYCVAMALMYGLVLLLGVVMLMAPAFFKDYLGSAGKGAEELDQVASQVIGGVYVIMGVLLALLYVAGAFLPARPWAWIVGIVLIALSFTSCCCIPVSIPLLIYWIKPATKVYFYSAEEAGRTV